MKINPSYNSNGAPRSQEAPEGSRVGVNVSMSPENKLEFVKMVTNAIEPEEVEYVNDVRTVLDACDECGCDECESKDVLYVTKIMAFADKFRVLHWAAKNHATHTVIDSFCDAMEAYKDAVAENIQAICGQFSANDGLFTSLKLPVGDNPLDVINQLKQTVTNWFESTEGDSRYEGCRNSTSEFLEEIYKTIYLLRLSK